MVVALREPPQTNEARRRFGSCHVTRPPGVGGRVGVGGGRGPSMVRAVD